MRDGDLLRSQGLQQAVARGLQCGIRTAQRGQAPRRRPDRAAPHDPPVLLQAGREPEEVPVHQQPPRDQDPRVTDTVPQARPDALRYVLGRQRGQWARPLGYRQPSGPGLSPQQRA